jgi:4-hydroxy-2-oxoheptanedioate aldolase
MAGIGITKITRNPITYALRNGLPSIGTWLSLCSPIAAESLASAGWDWLLVDVQHSLASFDTMVECFRAAQLGGAAPMARVPWTDTIWIQRTLDAGALGVLVPMVNTAADAEFVVQNTKYGPHGVRSFMRGRLAPYLDGDFRTWSDENIAVVVMIETVEAVKNAEAILSVPGVDCGFVGPSDLALSMGVSDAQTGPGSEHEAMIMSVLAAGKKVGRAVGIKCNKEDGPQRVTQGFQFIGVASDQMFMLKESAAQLGKVRQAIAAMGG